MTPLQKELSSLIRVIPDYPRRGVMFRDVTTLLLDSGGFRRSIDALVSPYIDMSIDYVAGIEARGFVLGGALSDRLGCGFVFIRKKGKLPGDVVSLTYMKEYGPDEVEVHTDALTSGDRVLLVDDLLATGGTAEVSIKLCRELSADVVSSCFIVDLPDLGGRSKIESLGVPVHALLSYEGE